MGKIGCPRESFTIVAPRLLHFFPAAACEIVSNGVEKESSNTPSSGDGGWFLFH
jgi:hypothetical protein